MTSTEVPVTVDTGPEEDEEPDRSTMVTVSICSADRMHYTASAHLPDDDLTGDAAIADAIVRVALAASHACSSGLWMELQRAIAHHADPGGGH